MEPRPDDAPQDPDHLPDHLPDHVPDHRVVKPEHLRRGGRNRALPLDADAAAEVPVGDDGQVDVEGEVHEGVEGGSVVLRGADGRTWQLGRSHAHLVGCTVALRGRPRRDVMTTAQQGVPLEVLAVEVVSGTPGEHGPGS